MALRIYNNTQALNAQRQLSSATSATSKTLEKLSSGLRINRASDDASGLAISEKLRGQIRGLKRASMNAQDGISFLQTAEGGLNEVSSILQRMRELAVQAGNGTYTTNDRKELQKEIDQLKDEINRISSSTEFNTKKLLNGDATALWSADKAGVDVSVKGAVVEGNYDVDVTVTAGTNNVYKTDIMTLVDGKLGAEIMSTTDVNIGKVSDPVSIQTTGTSYFTVTVGDTNSGVVSASSTYVTGYLQAGSAWAAGTNDIDSAAGSGYVEIEFTETTSAAGSLAGTDFRIRFINAKDGSVSAWVSGTTTANGISVNNAAVGIFTANITLGALSKIQSGDKMLFAVTESSSVTNMVESGGGTIQLSGGPDSVTGPKIFYTADSSLTKKDNGDATLDYNSVTFYVADLDATTGNLDIGSMTVQFKEQTQLAAAGADQGLTTSGSITVKINGGGEAATSTTRLKDIARFVNDDGRNVLDLTQELKIYGNGKEATIFIEGEDTINEFEQKLTDAIVNQLGMGADADLSSEFSTINSQLVNYIAPGEDTANSNESVNGTFIIQTAMLGDQSKLSFVGDQGLIDALSLAQIQEGSNSELKITVTDAHDGSNIGTETVNDYTMRNVLSGIEVAIDSTIGLSASWDSTNKELDFSADSGGESFKLHLVDNRTEIQIGANEGQTIDVSIAQVDTKSLEIDDVIVVDMESAQKAITKLDKALEEVSSTRASIGAQISRLESTIVNLDTSRENLTAAESRIRDLDIAEETSIFTRNQILTQASTAMLAQANQLPQIALQLLG